MVKTGAVDRATMIADGCTNYWSFLNSYYFAGTVVTTLGYGNVYPATNPGKVLTCAISGLLNPPRIEHDQNGREILMQNSGFLHLLRDDRSTLILLYNETNF